MVETNTDDAPARNLNSPTFQWRLSTLFRWQLAAAMVVVCILQPRLVTPIGLIAACYATTMSVIRLFRRPTVKGTASLSAAGIALGMMWIAFALVSSIASAILVGEDVQQPLRGKTIVHITILVFVGVTPWLMLDLRSIGQRHPGLEILRLALLGIWLVALPFVLLELLVYLLFEGYFDFLSR